MIPEFMSTDEAFEFVDEGADCTAIPFLFDRRRNYLDSYQVLKELDGDLDAQVLLVSKAQFCREAIEKIIGGWAWNSY
jgi:hypothetical protein